MTEDHPFYLFCETRMISESTRDEFVMWFRSYLDRYFRIDSEYLYGEVAKHIPLIDIQDYWKIFLKEKELENEDSKTDILSSVLRKSDDTD